MNEQLSIEQKREKMQSWLEYLALISPEDIDQEVGGAYIAQLPDSEDRECGVCIGVHYAIFSGNTEKRDANVLFKKWARLAANFSLDMSKEVYDRWLEYFEWGELSRIHYASFGIGAKRMELDFGTGVPSEFPNKMKQCIVECAKESGLYDKLDRYNPWRDENALGAGRLIPSHPFGYSTWPVPPIDAFKLYAKKYLGMEV